MSHNFYYNNILKGYIKSNKLVDKMYFIKIYIETIECYYYYFFLFF